jgi:large subunit ribosomal protein L18e
MPKPTGPTHTGTQKLIAELKRSKEKLYLDVARHLERPARDKKEVNIKRLAKLSKKNHIFIVPSKVLGVGELTKPIHVYALSFSKEAKSKINKEGKALPLNALLKEKIRARIVIR